MIAGFYYASNLWVNRPWSAAGLKIRSLHCGAEYRVGLLVT